MQEDSHDDLERRLRGELGVEQDPSRLEALSSALANLLRSRSALKDAEEGARLMLGREPEPAIRNLRLTLHQAIVRVLEDRGEPMKAAEIRDAVNRRNLYQRKDGAPVPSTQISARVRNYARLFRKLGDGRIELK